MCGIVGYVGSPRAAEYVMDGLRRLEYRGYDSAGVATVSEGKIQLRRRKGKLMELADLLRAEPLQGDIAIGHTRWATHGRPSDENAHPHHVDDVVVVHNGIIENFFELTRELQAQGRTFASETDTELIAHLVALETEGPLEARVRRALSRVRGAYALAVISEREPNTIVAAKNASPLVVGVVDGEGVLASDVPALLPYTRQVHILEEEEMVIIRPGEIILQTTSGEPIHREPRTISWSPVMAEKGGHKHFMHKEIHEQPRAIGDTLRGRLGHDATNVTVDEHIASALADAKRIMFTACGTSYHACLVGRLAFEELARIGCEVDLASELRYRTPLLGDDTLVLAVSQSGETADTLAALKEAKRLGSPTLSVVNVLDSSIARETGGVFYTHAGPEIGVASTKAFVTQVTALYMLAVATGRRRGLDPRRAAQILEALREIPRLVQEALDREPEVQQVAQEVVDAHSALFLGRGYGYPLALEGALKLKEISYIHAEGYAAGEMKHGPIALIEPEVPSIFIATTGPLYDKVLANLQEVRARDGRVIAIATEGDDHIREYADHVLYIPEVEPMLVPLVASVPLQLLAYYVADLRGTDIDQPRNLAKSVTVE